jgi:hypothetical protein
MSIAGLQHVWQRLPCRAGMVVGLQENQKRIDAVVIWPEGGLEQPFRDHARARTAVGDACGDLACHQ